MWGGKVLSSSSNESDSNCSDKKSSSARSPSQKSNALIDAYLAAGNWIEQNFGKSVLYDTFLLCIGLWIGVQAKAVDNKGIKGFLPTIVDIMSAALIVLGVAKLFFRGCLKFHKKT